MYCELCGSDILRGQLFVNVRAYVTITDAYGQRTDEPVVLEDGSPVARAHYGCMAKRCPELLKMMTVLRL